MKYSFKEHEKNLYEWCRQGYDVALSEMQARSRGRLLRFLILKAYEKIKDTKAELTDDAEAVEKVGHTVEVVPGSYDNIKITTREDLRLVELLLAKH